MKITNEKYLRNKENRIKSLISLGESKTKRIFNFLYKYYLLKDLSGQTPILPVFESIYIKNLTLPAWKLAQHCNMSRTTLFNYRNKIIQDFYLCLSKNLISEEIATTKGEEK